MGGLRDVSHSPGGVAGRVGVGAMAWELTRYWDHIDRDHAIRRTHCSRGLATMRALFESDGRV